MVSIFPAGWESLAHPAAAFGEAGIADLSFPGQDKAPGLVYCLADLVASDHGHALVTLAMVISTDVEEGMVIVVEPSDHFDPGRVVPRPGFPVETTVQFRDKGRKIFRLGSGRRGGSPGTPCLDLGHDPGPGDDRMGLEELQGGGWLHFR